MMARRWIVLVATALAGCGSDARSTCDVVRACCDTLPAATASVCRADVDAAVAHGTACDSLLAQLQTSGSCTAKGGNGGSGGGGGDGGVAVGGNGNADGAQPAVCARYVACATIVEPASASALIAAYGPSGSCWQSSQTTVDCTRACQTGLAQLHPSHPDDPSCALCASNSECGGATPACGPHGECVACTVDAQCGGATPACDTSTSQCVECTRDAQCASGGCNVAAHTCYQCTQGAQCTSGGCDPVMHQCEECTQGWQCSSGLCESNHTCCVPRSNVCSFPFPISIQYECGTDDDGCGHTMLCGTCAKGSCQNHFCSTVGTACTPGDATCLSSERCEWDMTSKSYRCNYVDDGKTCMSATDCATPAGPTGVTVDSYACNITTTADTCVQVCQTTAECASGKTCKPYYASTITTDKPGACL